MLLIIHDFTNLSMPATLSQSVAKKRLKTLRMFGLVRILSQLCKLLESLTLLPVLGKCTLYVCHLHGKFSQCQQ